jgi:hypothetical protein
VEKLLKGQERPVAHYHLAFVLLKTGDPGRAHREDATALKQDPNSSAKATVEPLFEGAATR